ncbi:transcriptional regulator, partial [Bacillus cereus]|nr:transcriptional regulator [Bacillus cereus]
ERADPYYASIRRGIELRCEELGLTLGQTLRGRSSIGTLQKADGLIVVGGVDPEEVVKLPPDKHTLVLGDQYHEPLEYASVRLPF